MAAILRAEVRDKLVSSSLRHIRNSGRIPGIVYGDNNENKAIHIDQKEFLQALRETGKNGIYMLKMQDGEQANVMISEVQKDPLKNQWIHLDFKRVNMNKPVTTVVPVTLIGQAQGVKDGGIIQFQTREMEIRCLPSDIPESIPLYVSDMMIGDSKTVADLQLPENVEVQHELDEVILSIAVPRLQPVEEDKNEPVEEPEVVGAKDGPGLDEAK